MPVRPLPENPNLEHLKYQAKDLQKEHAALSAAAAQRIREFHPRWGKANDGEIFAAKFRLSDAQLVIARERGFSNWARLKRHIEKPTRADQLHLPHHERIEATTFRRALELLDAGDAEGLRAHLRKHPGLVRQHVEFEGGNYFRNPTLLAFIAENPVRRGTLPKNIVELAGVILDSGVDRASLDDALMLVATGRVPRECGVQIPLINLLCDRGANADCGSEPAALHGELDALHALLARGAEMSLPVAAASGRVDHARALLEESDSDKRHLALALASQFGQVEIVRLLLEAGEDPNRFNSVGGHSHSTPLHQAAGNGHMEVVRLLVECGAKLETKDILFGGTPAGWAKYAGKTEVHDFLRSLETKKVHEV